MSCLERPKNDGIGNHSEIDQQPVFKYMISKAPTVSAVFVDNMHNTWQICTIYVCAKLSSHLLATRTFITHTHLRRCIGLS